MHGSNANAAENCTFRRRTPVATVSQDLIYLFIYIKHCPPLPTDDENVAVKRVSHCVRKT